jgi:hypothetical protein
MRVGAEQPQVVAGLTETGSVASLKVDHHGGLFVQLRDPRVEMEFPFSGAFGDSDPPPEATQLGVTGSDGRLHGYGGVGGLRTKAWLLKMEGALE